MSIFSFDGLKSTAALASLIGQDIVARSISLTQTAGNVAVQLVTGAKLKLGTGTTDSFTSDGATMISAGGVLSAAVLALNGVQRFFQGNSFGGSTDIRGGVVDGATSVANGIGNNPALSTAGAQIVAFYSDSFSTKQAAIDKDGRYLTPSPGDSTGAAGNATINKASGRSTIAAAASTCVITNSLVSATSIVLVVLQTNDATAILKNVVPTAGSFTVTTTAAVTGNTNFGWFVFNV